MVYVANAKPLGKAGRKRKGSGARGVKVYAELRLRDYAKLRRIAFRRQWKIAQVVRACVLAGLEAVRTETTK